MNTVDDVRIRFTACDDEATWVVRTVEMIGAALRQALEREGRARLLLSGGSTPLPVYERLGRTALPGHALEREGHVRRLRSGGSSPLPVYAGLGATDLDWSRIDIGLVDERDVPADDDGSNARLVRASLVAALASAGVDARFHALRERAPGLDDAVAAANADDSVDPAGAVVVLGMGDDGHTASLFPGSPDLERVLADPLPYAVLDANGCAGAGRHRHRMTLTRRGLDAAATRILLLRGEAKRRVFDEARAAGPREALPIRFAIDAPGPPLDVVWCRV